MNIEYYSGKNISNYVASQYEIVKRVQLGCKCEANMRDDRYILISICKTFRAQERPKTIEVFALFCIYHSYQICKSLKLNTRPLHKKDTYYFVKNYFVFFSWFTITIYICCPCAANH